MRTLMLIFNTAEARAKWDTLSAEEQEADMELHRVWFRQYRENVKGGEDLGWPQDLRILRRKSGRVIVMDGPFAETSEALGGYVMLESDDYAAAVAIASEWPGLVNWGARIELRPIPD